MFLMHKNYIVASIEIKNNKITNIKEIYNKERMPIGTYSEYKQLIPRKLENWMAMRTIPSDRQNKNKIEEALGMKVSAASVKAMLVSLTDCYWIKQEDSKLKWEDVNYHDNGFENEITGIVLFNQKYQIKNFKTPDITTDGILEKTWINNSGFPILLKKGKTDSESHILSANEVVASKIAKKMNIDHVEYSPIYIDETSEKISMCPCFIQNSNMEFVNALQIANETKLFNKGLYDVFKEMGFQQEVDKMIQFDYLIGNTDRHEKNFGIIRNAETLEIIAFAPLFDNGSSFGWNNNKNNIGQYEAKPFLVDPEKQLKLAKHTICKVPDFNTIKTIIETEYENFNIEKERLEIAIETVQKNYLKLKQLHISREDDFER